MYMARVQIMFGTLSGMDGVGGFLKKMLLLLFVSGVLLCVWGVYLLAASEVNYAPLIPCLLCYFVCISWLGIKTNVFLIPFFIV